jgi:hypothetical protein
VESDRRTTVFNPAHRAALQASTEEEVMPSKRTGSAGAGQSSEPVQTSSAGGGQGGTRSQGQESQTRAGSDGEQLGSKAQQLGTQAQEQVSKTVQSGKDRAADAVGSVAQSLRQSSQQLRDQQQQGMSRYLEQAATKIEGFADYLHNTSPGEMADGLENFARRQPALFLGGVFAVGFLGARFLKSSRRGQQDQQERARLSYPGTSSGGRQRGYGTGGRATGSYGESSGGYSASMGFADMPVRTGSESGTRSSLTPDVSTSSRRTGSGAISGNRDDVA